MGNLRVKMFGAVLWCDPQKEKALIWCEDHADLAYYTASKGTIGRELQLEAGDLVQFDVTELQAMRVADNVELVAAVEYPSLAEELQRREGSTGTPVSKAQTTQNSKIIAFPGTSRDGGAIDQDYNERYSRFSGAS